MQLRDALSRVQKHDKSITTYFNEVKSLSDILMSIGEPLRPAEFSAYLMAGLDGDYDALVALVGARAATDPMSVQDIYAQLLSTEQHVEARRAKLGADM